MKPGPIGTFRASCNRLREDHKDIHERRRELERLGKPTDNLPEDVFCNEVFDNFPDVQAHMKAVHPKAYREQRRTEPKITGPRKKPFGAPAVKHENQAVKPGTRFTYKGYDCQVIGAASSTRTRYLVWLPDGVDPSGSASAGRRHFELGKDEQGMWVWELTVPTKTILEAIAISEGAA